MTANAAESEKLIQVVREKYGQIAKGADSCCSPVLGGCCGTTDQGAVASEVGYQAHELAALPEGANLGLGCGAPVASLELKPGETVLDLGSGAGIDAFLAARQVGAAGRVIGVDLTPEMLERARANAARAGLAQVEFREGRLEALPVDDASVDAVTSNCVINLVPDKSLVFREVARVLRPGGRLVISDIVLDGELPEAIRQDVYAYVGCVSGAQQRQDYFAGVRAAGLGEVEVLKDLDYAGSLAKAAPEEAQALLDRSGVKMEQVIGKVRSITFRARKPA